MENISQRRMRKIRLTVNEKETMKRTGQEDKNITSFQGAAHLSVLTSI